LDGGADNRDPEYLVHEANRRFDEPDESKGGQGKTTGNHQDGRKVAKDKCHLGQRKAEPPDYWHAKGQKNVDCSQAKILQRGDGVGAGSITGRGVFDWFGCGVMGVIFTGIGAIGMAGPQRRRLWSPTGPSCWRHVFDMTRPRRLIAPPSRGYAVSEMNRWIKEFLIILNRVNHQGFVLGCRVFSLFFCTLEILLVDSSSLNRCPIGVDLIEEETYM